MMQLYPHSSVGDPSPGIETAAIRAASRRLVRELGFLRPTLAGTALSPSAVHALVEIGARGSMTAAALCDALRLEKSSISRMLRKLAASGQIVETKSAGDGRAKLLGLTPKGRTTLAAIDAFAERQVVAALAPLDGKTRRLVRDGLAVYAAALEADRAGPAPSLVNVVAGYRPGLLGRAVEMHADFYARTAGFGQIFESRVAAGLAEFLGRADRPSNGLWSAVGAERVLGLVAVDGETAGAGIAHLRWFIVADGSRGAGIGGRLLEAALGFCDRRGFAATELWTFQGLDAARRLYESHGFALAEERPGAQWGSEVLEQRFVRRREARSTSPQSG